jgi:glycosyltransferase involved in cell wall biosynthesis
MINFSVIIPTYNRANFIVKAINSVICQVEKNWELIIVDDGSTDNTEEIVQEFINQDNRIKYIYQQNNERSSARNKGIKNANGVWICFLDSDDLFHETHLTEFNKVIKSNNFQVGLYFSGLSCETYSQENEKYNLDYKKNIEFIILNSIGAPRACIHNEILLNHKFNEKIKIGEDRELWSRILVNYPLFFHKKKTFIEIDHKFRSINLGSEIENLNTIKRILKCNKALISKKVKMKSLSNAYFNLSKRQIKERNFNKATYFIIISLIYNLNSIQTKHKLLILIAVVFYKQSEILKAYK